MDCVRSHWKSKYAQVAALACIYFDGSGHDGDRQQERGGERSSKGTADRNVPSDELDVGESMRVIRASIPACLAAISFAQQNQLPSLRIAGNMTTIELAPILVAANGIYRGPVIVINGGIPNLMRGEVDAATNAETQLLRQSIDDPSLRVILTEAESFYRIVARRSSGIASVADLRGKKIAIAPYTSAHFYLVKSLAAAGVEEDAVTVVPAMPIT